MPTELGQTFAKTSMRLLKIVGLSILTLIVLGVITSVAFLQYRNWKRNQHGTRLVSMEATFMQYACGDENDDMKVRSVNDSTFQFMIGEDIDPELEDQSSFDLKAYFYTNRSDTFGMTYRLSGYLGKYPEFGCDWQASKFWVSAIEMINGQERITFTNGPLASPH